MPQLNQSHFNHMRHNGFSIKEIAVVKKVFEDTGNWGKAIEAARPPSKKKKAKKKGYLGDVWSDTVTVAATPRVSFMSTEGDVESRLRPYVGALAEALIVYRNDPMYNSRIFTQEDSDGPHKRIRVSDATLMNLGDDGELMLFISGMIRVFESLSAGAFVDVGYTMVEGQMRLDITDVIQSPTGRIWNDTWRDVFSSDAIREAALESLGITLRDSSE